MRRRTAVPATTPPRRTASIPTPLAFAASDRSGSARNLRPTVLPAAPRHKHSCVLVAKLPVTPRRPRCRAATRCAERCVATGRQVQSGARCGTQPAWLLRRHQAGEMDPPSYELRISVEQALQLNRTRRPCARHHRPWRRRMGPQHGGGRSAPRPGGDLVCNLPTVAHIARVDGPNMAIPARSSTGPKYDVSARTLP